MKLFTRRDAGWLVIVGLLSLLSLWLSSVCFSHRNIETVSAVVRSLESGDIHAGLSTHRIPAAAKPHFETSYRDPDTGKSYAIMVYKDWDRTVLIYYFDRRYYAACFVDHGLDYREKWYFCDDERLARHIELSLRQ